MFFCNANLVNFTNNSYLLTNNLALPQIAKMAGPIVNFT